jgi:hypothetical protein
MDRLNHELEYGSGGTLAEARVIVAEIPQVSEKAKWFFRAFHELQSDCQIGMDTGPIPFAAILNYAHEYGLAMREREAFNRIIRTLDDKTIAIRAEKRKRDEDRQSRKSSGGGAGTIVESW